MQKVSPDSLPGAEQSLAGIPGYWREASNFLARSDPVMAGLVERYGGTPLQSRGDPFSTLARSIVGQQISVKAADSVWRRFLGALPQLDPQSVLLAGTPGLQGCGLSVRKVEYLLDLACHFADGQVNLAGWGGMSNSEIIAELTAIRGIGVWTAEMLLIFGLLRPDVFPLDDIGLQKAVARHYCLGERPSRAALMAAGESWRPWRSVATWYLWRSLDPIPVEY